MAKKKTVKKPRISKERVNFVIALVVMVTMLLSGLYMLGSSDNTSQQTDEGETFYFTPYNTMSLNTQPVVATVNGSKTVLVAMVMDSCVSSQQVGWVYNLSLPWIFQTDLEAADAYRNDYGEICGNTLLFKFTVDGDADAEKALELENALENRLGNYRIKKMYVADVPLNKTAGIFQQVEVIGSVNATDGDYAALLIYQRTSDEGIFAIESKIIPEGPTLETTVGEILEYTVKGSFDEAPKTGDIVERLNASIAAYTSPGIHVNATLENATLEELEAIESLDVQSIENITDIASNETAALLSAEEVLGDAGVEYIRYNGTIILSLPVNASMDEAKEELEEAGIYETEFKKVGYAKLPSDIILDGELAHISDPTQISIFFDSETNKGDVVNVTLTSIKFGETAYIIGGVEGSE